MLGGLNWASDPRGWLADRPADPAHALVASNHTYDFTPCYWTCRAAYLGWGWFIAPSLTCEEGPTLIKNYAGAPTAFGIGLREHLRELRAGEGR